MLAAGTVLAESLLCEVPAPGVPSRRPALALVLTPDPGWALSTVLVVG